MSNWAIKVEGLGKRYRLSDNKQPDTVLGSIRSAAAKAMLRKNGEDSGGRDFWALRDVNFEVKPGERLGIVGPNGAGKSTLLKILSRVTAPTTGKAYVRGRLASLLEVGTGFHPELTGRENVFLNGAILGLDRAYISREFDSIVDFAGVERFIDTPIKFYSSGMHVRLAFAVAAHLDPEIMIIDEVLAVGDASFRSKATKKINESAQQGRTILLVSHNLTSVRKMCDRTILLEKGQISLVGNTTDVVEEYFDHVVAGEDGKRIWPKPEFVPESKLSSDVVECLGASIETEDGASCASLLLHKSYKIRLRYRVRKQAPISLVPNFHIQNWDDDPILVTAPLEAAACTPGIYVASCTLAPFTLNVGRYSVHVAMSSFDASPPVHFEAREALRFEVNEEVAEDPRRHNYLGDIPGVSRVRLDWRTSAISQ
jgi:lipopolysaccharide transport system ATP-binding protein